jgi:hypothetical protein
MKLAAATTSWVIDNGRSSLALGWQAPKSKGNNIVSNKREPIFCCINVIKASVNFGQ